MAKRIQIDRLDDRVLKASGPAIAEAIESGKIDPSDTFRDNVTPSKFLKELERKGVSV